MFLHEISICEKKMNIENLAKSRVKVTFDVTADDFEKALDKAFEICKEKVSVKGFRKGHVPRNVYEKNFGVESLFDEALNVVLNDKVKEIYANESLREKMCSEFIPNIESEKFERGIDFKVSLSFDVLPEVSLGKYKGLEVAKANPNATEEEINAKIEEELKKLATIATKEVQVIEKGDIAVFDFLGSVDGVPFPGGAAENYELTIGSGQFIPGFEDQMIGMKAEEEKDVVVTFPENYQAAELASKEATFKVTVHEVKQEQLPVLSDETVASMNIEGVTTVEALKENKKALIEATKAREEKDRQVDTLINLVLDNAVVDLPDSLIKEKTGAIRKQYEQQAKMYNIPFETFLGFMNVSLEKFEADIEVQGKRQALFNVVFSKLIEVENLTPTKEEIEEKAAKEAELSNGNKDALLKEKIGAYYSELAYNKLVDLLLTNAKEV